VKRDALKDEAWYERWVRYDIERIARMQDKLRTPAANRAYEPQYAFELAMGILEHGPSTHRPRTADAAPPPASGGLMSRVRRLLAS
jgi:hypothetical protein